MENHQDRLSAEHWRLHQIIGGEGAEEATEEDLISAISFSPSGNELAIGDNLGRVIIFQRENANTSSDSEVNYQFLTELTAHFKFFDYFRSEEIEPRIVDLKWLQALGNSHLILTATEKSMNVCRIKNGKRKTFQAANHHVKDINNIQMPTSYVEEKSTWDHSIVRTYPKLHNHTINSLSLNINQTTFISSDDTSIYMWNIEKHLEAYNLFEYKYISEDVGEIITSSTCSPFSESIFLFSTSLGARLCDNRKHNNTNSSVLRFEEALTGKKNIFTDYLNCVSDAKFVSDQKFVTRDLLSTKVWDVRVTSRPISTVVLCESLKTRLAEMYENDCILDKFSVRPSPCGQKYISGTFNRGFHLINQDGELNQQFTLDFKKRLIQKTVPKGALEPLPSKYDFGQKSLKLDWHPKANIVAVPLESSIFIYGCTQTQTAEP